MKFTAATLALAVVLATSTNYLAAAANYCPDSIAVQLNSINQGSSFSTLNTRTNSGAVIVRDSKSLTPSHDLAARLGSTLDITRAQLYDSVLQFGVGTTKALVKTTNDAFTMDVAGTSGNTLTVNGHSVDEVAWLSRFLQERLDSSKSSVSNVAGVKSYRSLINTKQYTWGTSVTALTIGDKSINIQC